MVDETDGRQAVELMESTVFNQETLYADIQIDADSQSCKCAKSDAVYRNPFDNLSKESRSQTNLNMLYSWNKAVCEKLSGRIAKTNLASILVEMELNWDNRIRLPMCLSIHSRIDKDGCSQSIPPSIFSFT